MIGELRIYTITFGYFDEFVEQFTSSSMQIFSDHGVTLKGPWRRSLVKGDQLIYIVEFNDEADREAKWSECLQDPRFQKSLEARANLTPFVSGIEVIALGGIDPT